MKLYSVCLQFKEAPRLEILTFRFTIILNELTRTDEEHMFSILSDDIPHQGSEQGGGAMRGLRGPLLPWTPDEEGSVEECEEEPVKGILPQCLFPGTSRRAAYETSRQAAIGAQGAATWDLEASRDRKRAESQKPLWHRGITLQEMLQILLAPEKGIVFIWLHMSLDCTVTPRGPREQTL